MSIKKEVFLKTSIKDINMKKIIISLIIVMTIFMFFSCSNTETQTGSNNTFDTAFLLTNTSFTLAGKIENENDDYYKVDLASGYQYTITLDGFYYDLALYLYNSSQNTVVFSDDFGTIPETLTAHLKDLDVSDYYYIRVAAKYLDTTTDYILSISKSTDGNDSFYGADLANILPLNTEVSNIISPGLDIAYYRTSLTNTNTYTIIISNASSDLDIYLYNSSFSNVAFNTNTGVNKEISFTPLTNETGTYYVKVASPSQTTTTYKLLIND